MAIKMITIDQGQKGLVQHNSQTI